MSSPNCEDKILLRNPLSARDQGFLRVKRENPMNGCLHSNDGDVAERCHAVQCRTLACDRALSL